VQACKAKSTHVMALAWSTGDKPGLDGEWKRPRNRALSPSILPPNPELRGLRATNSVSAFIVNLRNQYVLDLSRTSPPLGVVSLFISAAAALTACIMFFLASTSFVQLTPAPGLVSHHAGPPQDLC
jgi:hypothetical protein